MKIHEINTNLAGEDPNGLIVEHHPIFGDTVKVGVYHNPKSLLNFHDAKGIFIFNGDMNFILIEHQMIPHGNLFCSLRDAEVMKNASKFCKINLVDTKRKELVVNSYFNYPDYQNIIEDIRKFVDEHYNGWKVIFTKETINVHIDCQYRNLYKK